MTQTSKIRKCCKQVKEKLSRSETDRFWNEARINRLITLWNDGLSGEKCAAILGTTKSAVLSKIRALRRLGIQLRGSTEAGRSATGSISRRRQIQASETRSIKFGDIKSRETRPRKPYQQRESKSTSCDERIELDMELPEDADGLIFDVRKLKPYHCRWVFGDPLLGVGHYAWCGRDRVPGTKWCKTHNEVIKQRSTDEAAAELLNGKARVLQPA